MLKKFLSLVFASFVLAGCTLPSFLSKQSSGLQVTSTPQGTVFLDGNSIGTTPHLEENIKPGLHTIKIVPSDPNITPWETEINLSPKVLTIVNRQLSATIEQSHGYTMSFESLSGKDIEVAIVTIPDSVTITINGKPKGFSPLSLDTIPEGEHTILLSSPGFEDKVINARTINGYNLTITAQLAKKSTPDLALVPVATPSATPIPTPTTAGASDTITITPLPPQSTASAVPKPYLEVNSPPPPEGVGFLRVRSAPNGTELAKINHGERFPYVESKSGWHKIEYTTDKFGWVSGAYATVVK